VERRFTFEGATRYPVAMEIKYKIRSRTPRVGMGQTSSMSSREVVFTADQPIQEGTLMEVSIAWPALLNNRVALQLVIDGEIVRCGETEMTARIIKHHFRTRGPWLREENTPRPALVYTGQVQPQNQEALWAR